MRGNRQAILGVAAVALIALLAGCVGRGQAAPFGRNDRTSAAAPSASALEPSIGATSPGQRPPTGFVPASASFPTAETGFAWGIYPCPIDPNAFCPGLAVTRDGGETWKLRTPPAGTPIDPYHPAILRFTDIINGWAVLGDQLQVTHDGAATWQTVQLPGTQNPASQPIVALETGTVSVYVVAGPTTGPLHLYRSGTSGTTFELIGGVSLPGAGATVHLSFGADGSGYLAADSVTGSNPTIFATTNGVTWVPRPSPCASGSRTAIAAGSAGTVGVICDTNANGNGASKQLWTSTDAGITFVPTEGPAETGFTTAMAVVPTVSLPVALPTTGSAIIPAPTYVVAASAGEDRLYLGLNGGRSWTVAYANSGDASGAALGLTDLSFSDAVHGMVLLGNAGLFAKDRLSGSFAVLLPRLLITTDGGRHWAQSVIH